jgi:hypothetical protein
MKWIVTWFLFFVEWDIRGVGCFYTPSGGREERAEKRRCGWSRGGIKGIEVEGLEPQTGKVICGLGQELVWMLAVCCFDSRRIRARILY